MNKMILIAASFLFLNSEIAMADFNLVKICGFKAMGATAISGRFALKGQTGEIEFSAGATGLNLKYPVGLVGVRAVPLPKDPNDQTKIDSVFLKSMSQLGVVDPIDGSSYELQALTSAGQPLQNIFLMAGTKPIENRLYVDVIPYGGGKNFITLSVNLDHMGILPVSMGTDDCP